MLEGLQKIRQRTQVASSSNDATRIKYLYLGDNEYANVRFLTDSDKIISDMVHSVEETTERGKRYRKYHCTKSEVGSCKHCADGNVPGQKIYLWAWVTEIMHKKQNPDLEQNPDAPRWKVVKKPEGNFYQEIVNEPRIFRTGPGKGGAVKNAIIGFADEYGTMTDRDYRWTKSKTGPKDTDVSYGLTPRDPKPAPLEAIEAAKTLPSLSDVLLGKVKNFGQEAEAEEVAEETKSEESLF